MVLHVEKSLSFKSKGTLSAESGIFLLGAWQRIKEEQERHRCTFFLEHGFSSSKCFTKKCVVIKHGNTFFRNYQPYFLNKKNEAEISRGFAQVNKKTSEREMTDFQFPIHYYIKPCSPLLNTKYHQDYYPSLTAYFQ